jgi:O-acetyl-ADP-ribose deacetylase (regulator of RNase III)
MKEKVKGLLKSAGMFVLGTAGYERSINTLFDALALENAANEEVLSFGLFWGVYMAEQKPRNLTAKQLEEKVEERIGKGVIGPHIVQMMGRAGQRNERFCFFPIWGTGAFMFDLIKATENKLLIGTAELYLDHVMRLRTVFTRAGLSDAAVDKHIASLEEQRGKISPKDAARAPAPELVFTAHSKDKKIDVELSVIYGDITSRSQMSAPELQHLQRAVVSPEDTCISAGGGVAYLLLEKAGPYTILNELSKFSPIEHDTVCVTSGGNLPVHYIFHAAAIEIEKDANYAVSKQDVAKTMTAVLEKAKALDVGVLWVPLMGAGVGSLGPKKSFEGIVESLIAWMSEAHSVKIRLVIYRERELPRNEISRIMQNKLSRLFSIEAV